MAAANAYRFSSKEWCATPGFYYYGYRLIDPMIQRWLNRDPIFENGGYNIYSTVYNNPVNTVDCFGLDSFFCGDKNALHGKGHNALAVGDEQNGYDFRSFSAGQRNTGDTSYADNLEMKHFNTLNGLEQYLWTRGYNAYLKYNTTTADEENAIKTIDKDYKNTAYKLGYHDCINMTRDGLTAAGVETVCSGGGAALPGLFFNQNVGTGDGRFKKLPPPPPTLVNPTKKSCFWGS